MYTACVHQAKNANAIKINKVTSKIIANPVVILLYVAYLTICLQSFVIHWRNPGRLQYKY